MVFDPVAYRASRAKEYTGTPAQAVPAPAAPEQPLSSQVFKPWQEARVLTTDQQEKAKQSFVRKVGEDALTLGLVPSALVATIPDLAAHPLKTTGRITEGFVSGVIDMFDPQQWRDHPLLNAVNTVANITVVGGIIKSAALNSVRGSAINAAKTAAIEAGADAVVVDAAFKSARPMKAALYETVRTGSLEPAISSAKVYLKASGLAEETADSIARSAIEQTVGKYLSENKTKLALINAMANPIQAFGKASFVSRPIQELIFGRPEQSAVGKLYGSDTVTKDVRGFGQLEEWAGMQAAERGLNTVENRVRVMQEWVDQNPEYAALTPEQRVAHFKEYASADLVRQRFAENHSRSYVLTKALPEHYVEAMVEFVNTLPKNLSNSQVIEKLTEVYGKDFGLHAQEVTAKLAGKLEKGDRAALVEVVKGLGNNHIPISVARLTKAEKQLVKDLEGSGYRIGRAPTKKKISQASEMKKPVVQTTEEAAKTEAALKEELLAQRTTLGRLVDRFGLSPEGVVEGTQYFAFREAFTQSVLKLFGNKKTIVIEGVKYPIESLAFQLERLRRSYMGSRSGILPPIHTIADLRYRDLIKLGFVEKDAFALDKIIRESNVASPSITGIGEAFSNYLRTRNNPLSRAYNNFLRWQSDYRFKKNPMFGLQAAVESVVWGNMWTKTFPGTKTIARTLGRLTGLKTPIIEASRESTLAEQQMVLNEVMTNYNRQLRDAGMSPEIYRGSNEAADLSKTGIAGVQERLAFEAKNVDSNIWLGVAGFSNVKVATNLMRSYARRFGMELEDALRFKIVDGKKVYDHSWLVDNMQNAAQAIFGYKAGILTSPMIRTLNVAFFPIRFQTKTMIQTAQWLGSLSPMSRLFVVNQLMATADWLTTPEGQQWRKKNRGLFASMFNYVFAFEGLGKSVNAATKGQLFGGNTGLIGGLPFGFVVNIARDLGYVAEDKQINLNTGMPYQREVIRDPASFGAFVTVVEDIIISMLPSMPFNTATGGAVTVSINRATRDFIEQVLSAAAGAVLPGDAKDFKRDIRREKIKVRPEYQKKLPSPIDLVAPKAQALSLSDLNPFRTLKYERKDPLAPTAEVKKAGKNGVVLGVDISDYATDPGHEEKIANIASSIPSMGDDAVAIDEYIKARAPKSPVRGGMIKRAAAKYGVAPELLLAILQNDSAFGTRGKGVRTRNPGNYGNDDTGKLVHFKSWEDGVLAVAKWLSEHKTEISTT